MESLFIPETNQKIIFRIEKLHPVSKPLWGRMNVSQMLAHCQAPLLVALNEKKLKRTLMGILFGNLAKRKLMRDKAFPQNLPTEKSFIIGDERDFQKEKSKLIDLIRRFLKTGESGISKEPHPFFGRMTGEEWGVLNYKHLDHHLNQFGV